MILRVSAVSSVPLSVFGPMVAIGYVLSIMCPAPSGVIPMWGTSSSRNMLRIMSRAWIWACASAVKMGSTVISL